VPYPRVVNSSETSRIQAASQRPEAVAAYSSFRDRRAAEIAAKRTRSDRLSLARLIAFLAGGACIATALSRGDSWAWIGFCACVVAFIVAVVLQQIVMRAIDDATIRHDLHERHLQRLSDRFSQLPSRGDGLLPHSHAYAWDIDVVGEGSLFQRIDVTQTVHGEQTLVHWLGEAAPIETIRERQAAVGELAAQVEFRESFEAAALMVRGPGKLDGTPFRDFAQLPSFFAPRPWLAAAIWLLPLATLAGYLLGLAGLLPSRIWLLPLAGQMLLLYRCSKSIRRALDLATARQGAVEAFERMLAVVERAKFESPLLRAIQERLAVSHIPPSAHMRSLRSWTSAAELRQQFLFYIVINPFTLWDLHVLRGLENWNRRVGRSTADWFAALGELEALSSLAVLCFGDNAARMPEIVPAGGALYARGLAHPLLVTDARVANDVDLPGPGCALIVTGSNMAGKSTLLRALGLNVSLALAGGPVCAAAMQVPLSRLRASIRTEDSLQRGASYFQAELIKLRTVVEAADAAPPVLFLLDELLRGTNARARHLGARAVLLHLLKRSGMGICATHDVALAALEEEYKGRIRNVHFTDVVQDGEMRFDYRLRPGVVQTSNALRLLAMAGIDVPSDDAAAAESQAAAEVRPFRA
jgi:hypothetical protein